MDSNTHIKRLLTAIALNNDQVSYKELFMLLHSQLKQFAYSILKSQEEAEDLVSEVFIKIWERRDQLTAIESPLLYFYTTTKNFALNRLKKQKRLQSQSTDEWFVQLNSVYFDPEQLMMTEEIVRKVRDAVNTLPPRCRLIFKLIKEDGLKYKEVSELLNLSIKTVEAQMAIALRRLGKCMHLEIKFLHSSNEILKNS